MTTQKTREDQLRRDARRIGMTIQKGRWLVDRDGDLIDG